MKNYYEILEINEDASKEQIKEAYWRLAQKYHPDKNKNENSAELFKDINEAKQVLLDDKKKSEYDLFLIDYLLANDFTRGQKKTQHQENYFDETKRRKQFKLTQKFILIIAFVALIIFTVMYLLLKQTNATTKKINNIKAAVFKNTKPAWQNNINDISKVSVAIKPVEAISKPVLSKKEIGKKIEKKLTSRKMIQILQAINAKKYKLNIETNCIKICKTNNSNVQNAFEIANFLQQQKFVISGREIIKVSCKGIQIDTSGRCIKLIIGSI